MKLWAVYIDGVYFGCVEAENRTTAADRAIEKYPVKISSKLSMVCVQVSRNKLKEKTNDN